MDVLPALQAVFLDVIPDQSVSALNDYEFSSYLVVVDVRNVSNSKFNLRVKHRKPSHNDVGGVGVASANVTIGPNSIQRVCFPLTKPNSEGVQKLVRWVDSQAVLEWSLCDDSTRKGMLRILDAKSCLSADDRLNAGTVHLSLKHDIARSELFLSVENLSSSDEFYELEVNLNVEPGPLKDEVFFGGVTSFFIEKLVPRQTATQTVTYKLFHDEHLSDNMHRPALDVTLSATEQRGRRRAWKTTRKLHL